MSSKNRRKGHNAERYYMNEFKKLGYKFCKTTRSSSRLLDDCKIDLDFLPFNVQIKAGLQKGMNVEKVLTSMKEMLVANFPKKDPVHYKPRILIHRKDVGKGRKRKDKHDLVYFYKSSLIDGDWINELDITHLWYFIEELQTINPNGLCMMYWNNFKTYIDDL